MNQSIVACGQRMEIGNRVVLWNEEGGWDCPNRRGRAHCSHHDPVLDDRPTRSKSAYRIEDPSAAYERLQQTVHQLVLHYDVCYCSYQCHQIMQDSTFKGSHFYLDIDGTLYQTCDLYWKTNTGPGDDRIGNERSVHVEMANLSWEALQSESTLYHVRRDQYRKVRDRWELILPEKFRDKIRTPGFKAVPSRSYGERGYFSRRVNGNMVRMWDFTEEQYRAVIRLAIGINRLLPRIKLQVPRDPNSGRVPLGRIKNFARFCGILGHAHVQGKDAPGVGRKFDPGSAFNWSRLRKDLLKEEARRRREKSHAKSKRS